MFYSSMDLFLKDELSLEEIKSSLKKVKEGGWVTDQKVYCFNEMMTSLTGLTKKYEILIMDFRKEFYSALEKNEQLYYDWIHLTPKGNDLLARLIFENRSWNDDKK